MLTATIIILTEKSASCSSHPSTCYVIKPVGILETRRGEEALQPQAPTLLQRFLLLPQTSKQLAFRPRRK